AVEVADGVFLGRAPDHTELSAYSSVIDMTAEFPVRRIPGLNWQSIPSLDLLQLSPASIRAGAMAVDDSRSRGPVLVCCALGFQRSAAVVACWLVRSGRATNAAMAAELLMTIGRPVHLKRQAYKAIDEAAL